MLPFFLCESVRPLDVDTETLDADVRSLDVYTEPLDIDVRSLDVDAEPLDAHIWSLRTASLRLLKNVIDGKNRSL